MHKATVLAGVARAKAAVQDLAIPAKLVVRTSTFVPGSPVTPTESLTDIKIVITAYKSSEVDGQRILASDLMGLIFPETSQPIPKADDVIRISAPEVSTTVDYRIIANSKVMAGTELALSQVQMRLT